jgi:serine/threonine-protein kinase
MENRRIGRYEVIEELGKGGMATVYHAYDPRFEREVAIKVLPREFLHERQFRARFEREAKTIAALEHSAIVPVYDFGEEDGLPYLVMRYMPGGSLVDKLAQKQFDLDEAITIIKRLAPALDHAHRKGVVHRDLKPGNILFDEYGDAYLSDFGIAKLSQATTALTGSMIVGTPAYMSPEQALAKYELDGRSDVYSLGVVFFVMLAGKCPYQADTPMGLALAHINDPIPDILDINPGLPATLKEVITSVLAKDREERFATAGDFVQVLEQVSTGEQIADHPSLLQEQSAVSIPAPSSEKVKEDDRTHDDLEQTSPEPYRDQGKSLALSKRLTWSTGGAILIGIIIIVSGMLVLQGRQGLGLLSGLATPTYTMTVTNTATATFTLSPTNTSTRTSTKSTTPTSTASATPTNTATSKPTRTKTATSRPVITSSSSSSSVPTSATVSGYVTYTVNNQLDWAQFVIIDKRVAFKVPANSTRSGQVAIGTHYVQFCSDNKGEFCGPLYTKSFTSDRTDSITWAK